MWACDFLQVTDFFFRSLFAFFLIELKSRKVVHVGLLPTLGPHNNCVKRLRMNTRRNTLFPIMIVNSDSVSLE